MQSGENCLLIRQQRNADQNFQRDGMAIKLSRLEFPVRQGSKYRSIKPLVLGSALLVIVGLSCHPNFWGADPFEKDMDNRQFATKPSPNLYADILV